MDRAQTVDELLRAKKITPEEEERLCEIIEECRLREAQIKEVSDAARQNLEALSGTLEMIFDAFAVVKRGVDELHDEVERLQLRMMPEGHFYRE